MAGRGRRRAALPSALTEGFQIAFIVGAGFAILGAILAATLISGARQPRARRGGAARRRVARAPAVA